MHSEVFQDLVNSAQTTDFVALNLEGGEQIPYLVNTECETRHFGLRSDHGVLGN